MYKIKTSIFFKGLAFATAIASCTSDSTTKPKPKTEPDAAAETGSGKGGAIAGKGGSTGSGGASAGGSGAGGSGAGGSGAAGSSNSADAGRDAAPMMTGDVRSSEAGSSREAGGDVAGRSDAGIDTGGSSPADAGTDAAAPVKIERILLLDVDGLHESDMTRWVAAHPDSAFAALRGHGVAFSNASSSKPSDSFPGLLAQLTGGSPKSTGVYYDVSYDRTLFAASNTTCTGAAGTTVPWDESIDFDADKLNGGGGIDPAKLPRDKSKNCMPVWPRNFLRVNTIFGVVHAAGKRTAWLDKHPAYDIVNGPGDGKNVDDLYLPEVDSIDATSMEAFADSTEAGIRYDDLKVAALLNQISGKAHDGTGTPGVPVLFGMNFQAISITQKLKGTGAYTAADGTPTTGLAMALTRTDASIAMILAALKTKGLEASTVVVLSAKHGQSPIDPAKIKRVKDDVFGTIVGATNILSQDADDIGLLWLKPGTAVAAAAALTASIAGTNPANIDKVISGTELISMFDNPATDSRVPDVIVLPKAGTVYLEDLTPVKLKAAEHGGFSEDDVHVPLVIWNPAWDKKAETAAVTTTQIAPTILKILGLNPQDLDAVKKEGTATLPGF